MHSGAEQPAISRLVLDTSAYSWMRSGDDRVLSLIARAEITIIPVTVLGELEAGFELGNRPQQNRSVLAEFLAEPFVSVRPTTPKTARWYGEILAELRRAGTPIPVNDIWIAATTRDCGGTLVTFDHHFRSVPDLAVIVLEPNAV